ncbi:class I SAM-dependent methyltransferase [Nocardioides sp. CER19]|uniref:class I SAM-dependent methyltransferase n=1 Tax=Nocardioides sp. CER19 TaxID=3038538 RepID=UPI00244860DC|nr:class I SAM-dependent methyltransferase [Nocardioides sp. CER19]MDH2416409.1 methyltransferase domain-containing protein [Nocardioides sp. CER19]
MTDVFTDRLQAWRDYCELPYPRIRYAVVGEVLRRHATALGERLRVLDVGGGDGRDSITLAQAGHEVTIVDPTAAWLDEAQRRAAEAGTRITTVVGGLDDLPDGTWDLVICHYVLRYRPADAADVAALAARVRSGGRLSLVDANPDGAVLGALLREGPAAALAELESDSTHTVTFDHDVRKVAPGDVETALDAEGLRVVGRYGHRIANDLRIADAATDDPSAYDALLRLELALCDREPFHRVGFAWQIVAERQQ